MCRLIFFVVAALGVVNCGTRPDTEGTIPGDVPPTAQAALTHPEFTWVSGGTPDFSVHAVEGSYGADHLDEFVRAVERAWSHDLDLLGGAPDVPHLELFFVTSREQIRMLAGRAAGGLAVPKESTVFFGHDEDHRGQLRHELMHVLAYHRWGERKDSWVSEGLATFASGSCRDYGIRELAAALDSEKKLVPLKEFEGEFTVTTAASYLQAASVVQYLYETHGLFAVRTLYQTGLSATLRALGQDVVELDRLWREWVDDGRGDRAIDWEAIRQFGCE